MHMPVGVMKDVGSHFNQMDLNTVYASPALDLCLGYRASKKLGSVS